MLFANFSWQDFLWVAALLAVLWYVLVWLFFFRGKGGDGIGVGRERVSDMPLQGLELDEAGGGLLGRSVPALGESVVSADEFGFVGSSKEEQLGVVADAQEHIRSVCRELESSLAEKEAFLLAFSELLGSYAVPLSARLPLQEFIREQVPFFISEDELDGLWN